MRLASAMAFTTGTVTLAPAAPAMTQVVRVVVAAPPGTLDEAVYLAVDAMPGLPTPWRPNAVRLARQPDGTYAGDVTLRLGSRPQFKVTRRGDWPSVEKRADGRERDNRSFAVESTVHRIDLRVERWADQ